MKKIIAGVPFDTFKKVLQAWQKSDQEYRMYGIGRDSKAQKHYQRCLQPSLARFNGAGQIDAKTLPHTLHEINIDHEDELKNIYPYLQNSKPFIRYALEEFILPTIELYPLKLTSNAINHVSQVKSIEGFSGTIENHPTFHRKIYFDDATSFGVKSYLKTLLRNKKTPLRTQGEEKIEEALALIDIGAHRRGQNNLEVAKDIAKQCKNTAIKWVLFFQDEQLSAWKVGGTERDILSLPSTEPQIIEHYLQVKPHQLFTYYDQNHTTDINILQDSLALAIVTADDETTLHKFLQAIARMRNLSAGQQIEIVLSSALKAKLGENPTLDEFYTCLENTEKTKLAEDVLKAACKMQHNVVKEDLDNRLLKCDKADDRRHLFQVFQCILVDKNIEEERAQAKSAARNYISTSTIITSYFLNKVYS